MKISNKVRSLFASVVIIAMSFGMMMTPAFADVVCPEGSIKAGETVSSLADCGFEDCQGRHFSTMEINLVLFVVGIVAIVVIIVGGVSCIISAKKKNADRLKKVKKIMVRGTVILAVIILIFVIVNFVAAYFDSLSC